MFFAPIELNFATIRASMCDITRGIAKVSRRRSSSKSRRCRVWFEPRTPPRKEGREGREEGEDNPHRHWTTELPILQWRIWPRSVDTGSWLWGNADACRCDLFRWRGRETRQVLMFACKRHWTVSVWPRRPHDSIASGTAQPACALSDSPRVINSKYWHDGVYQP